MRVAVEEAVAEDHRQPGLGDHVREAAALLHRPRFELQVGELDAVQELEREHPLARVAPVDARHRDVRVAGEVAVERLRVPAFLAVVELETDRAGELVDDLTCVDEVERAHALLDELRGLLEQLDVALDLARRIRALHLHCDAAAVGKNRPVHLADRRRRDGRLLELEEEPCDRLLQVLEDHPLDVGVRERLHVVLEAAELRDDVGRHDVRPRREQLAELHERRPELVEHLAQVLAAQRRRARVAVPAAVDDEAEAVPHRDLGDLAQAADARGLRARRSHPLQCDRALPSAGERGRDASVDRDHRAGRRARPVADEERDRLGHVRARDGSAEQAPRGVERLELVDARRRARPHAAAGSRPTRGCEPAKIASGLTALARMPCGPPSSAAMRISWTRPAFATEYGPKPAPGAKAFFEAT